jgi:hypothetical protein
MDRFELGLVLCCQLGLVACGITDAPSGALPYETNRTAVIGGDFDNPDGPAHRGPEAFDSDECIDLDGACQRPQKDCGALGVADVLIDDSGTVVDVICYPTRGVSIETVDGEIGHFGNNVVVVLDDDDDGIDIAGDVTIDGNNVVLFGHGPDVSVIGGDLNIAKNYALVRGIHVAGDVTIEKNNTSIVDCVIEGDLTIRGNNTSLALCDVLGTLTIEGNNTALVRNFFASTLEIYGNNTRCGGNRVFIDLDRDGRVSDDEVGDILACSSSGKPENKPKVK